MADPIDDEIKTLYEGSNFVSVGLTIHEYEIVRYEVRGLSDLSREIYPAEWEATGGVDGSFVFLWFGYVTTPEPWKGYKVQLHVNEGGSSSRVDYEPEGLLGMGMCSEKKVLLFLNVKPQIARDILDKVFYINKIIKENEHYFRFDLVDLKRTSPPVKEGISFRVSGLYC